MLEQPLQLSVRELPLVAATANDLVVDISWSGISTGTEKLLWSGRMPTFPGMGYPLVPGYESVGRVAQAGASTNYKVGEMVFVPGAACFGDVRGLFGGAASRVVILFVGLLLGADVGHGAHARGGIGGGLRKHRLVDQNGHALGHTQRDRVGRSRIHHHLAAALLDHQARVEGGTPQLTHVDRTERAAERPDHRREQLVRLGPGHGHPLQPAVDGDGLGQADRNRERAVATDLGELDELQIRVLPDQDARQFHGHRHAASFRALGDARF